MAIDMNRTTTIALPDSLGLPHEDAGDYLIIGLASAGDRKAVAAKAAALAVSCVEYVPEPTPEPEPEPTPTPEPTPAPDSGKDDTAACTEQLGRIEAKLDKLLGLLGIVTPALLEG